ncbi:TPA: hypothetical protein OND39_004437 [Enterobacter asburiae]|nr:hypothetical protein [Enterobacter asburiae]
MSIGIGVHCTETKTVSVFKQHTSNVNVDSKITVIFTAKNLPVFDYGIFGAGVVQEVKPVGMLCNLIESNGVECLAAISSPYKSYPLADRRYRS